MSPRYEPRTRELPPDVLAVQRVTQERALEALGRCTWSEPYQDGCIHSFYLDLLEESRSRRRAEDAIAHPILRGRDQGEIPSPATRDDTPERRRRRLGTVQQRDLSQSGVTDVVKPSLPGYL